MSVIIFKPRQYAEGFATSGTPARPSNGSLAAAPYDRDTRVREITRYTGTKTVKYADTGEFELTLLAGQVLASDVQKDYLVLIDGDPFIIEAYEWGLGEEGYECTISGRDFGAYLDNSICTEYMYKDGKYNASSDGKIAVPDIQGLISRFFDGKANPAAGDFNIDAPERCGWFRDEARKGDSWCSAAFEDTSATGTRRGSNVVQEVMSYGAILRTFCSWYGIGYRWRVTWDEDASLYKLGIELYNRAGGGVMIRSNMRGVSDFSYKFDARDSVNAIAYSASTSWNTSGRQDKDNKVAILGMSFDRLDAKNNSDFANAWHSKFVDVGDVPDESDTSRSAAEAWVRSQSVTDEMSRATETISFTYDNTGMFRFGEHFALGDRVTIVDDFLGIGSEQTLTEVTTTYDAGKPKSYGFSFGDSSVKQADKLKRKFAEIDRRTYAPRKTS